MTPSLTPLDELLWVTFVLGFVVRIIVRTWGRRAGWTIAALTLLAMAIAGVEHVLTWLEYLAMGIGVLFALFPLIEAVVDDCSKRRRRAQAMSPDAAFELGVDAARTKRSDYRKGRKVL